MKLECKFVPISNNNVNSQINNNQLILECKYNGQVHRFLIDTAAETSVMWCDINNNKNLLQKKYRILGLGNNCVKTYGFTNVKFVINNDSYRLPVHVVQHENFNYSGLLGIDFLHKYKAVIDIGKHELTLHGKKIPLVSCVTEDEQQAEVSHVGVMNPPEAPTYSPLKLQSPLKISPGNTRIIFLRVNQNTIYSQENSDYVVEPLEINQALDEKRIYVARTVSRILKNKCGGKYCNKKCLKCTYHIPIQITNFNNTEVHLIKGTFIARYIAIDHSDIMNAELLTAGENKNTETRNINHISYEDDNYTIEALRENEKILNEKLKHLPPEIQEQYKYLILHEFRDVFIEKQIREGTHLVQHEIRLDPDRIVRSKPYKIGMAAQPYADEVFKQQVDSATIRPSTSPYNSGIVLVRKKTADGSIKYRVTLDLRGINNLTIIEPYPLINIQDSINHLSNCKYFTTLDLKDGFYNIPIAEGSKKYTAFTIPSGPYSGHWEYNYMCQGLKNASASLQRFMDGLLHNLSPLIVLCYIDDLCLFSNTMEENIDRLRLVLQRLQYGNVTVNLSKCQFAVEKINFLGYIIENNTVTADPRLVQKIKDFEIPTDIRDVMAWNGLSGYYRALIKDYAEINRPISDLLKNHQNNLKKKVKFTDECILAFNTIKQIMTSSPVLTIADPTKEFRLCVDCSGWAAGSVLEQLGDDGKYHPCAYASRKLTPREQAESAAIRECIALCWALKHFKFYLYGQPHFTILVDNAALQHLLTMKNPNGKLLRMALEIGDYNFSIIHRAGKSHANADAMSRFVNNINITVFDLEDLQKHQEHDPDCRKLSKKENFFKKDGILYFNSTKGPRAVAPKSLRNIILKQNHDSILSGHPGKETTNKNIAKQYYWPNRQREVDFYCMTCAACSARRMHDKTNMPLVEMPQPAEPFEFVGIDITQLPATENYQYILTIVDFFSRFLVMVPMKNQEASTVAKAFVENFILKYNCPKFLYSDLGRQFESKLFSELCKLLCINKLRTTPRHPASNGKTEIVHKDIKKILSYYVNKHQSNWPSLLHYAVCIHNSKVHHSTRRTPYEIVYGRNMRSPFTLITENMQDIENEDIQALAEKLHTIWSEVYNNNHKAFQKYAKAHDKKTKEVVFKVGDFVWLHDDTVKRGNTKKLQASYFGPYEVVEILSKVNTKIKLPNRLLTVHNNRLKLYKQRADNAASFVPQVSHNTTTHQDCAPEVPLQPSQDNPAEEEATPSEPSRHTRPRRKPGFYEQFY